MPETQTVTFTRSLHAQRRRRSLASDERAGSWARGHARRAQREFLRETWWLFGSFTALAIGAAVVCGLFIPSAFMRGLVLGVALVAAPGAVWIVAMQYTNTAPIMMGDQAEQWTAQELRRLTRRGWRLLNHFSLRVDDIDHVLLGPGGAYAVETKWSGSSWQSDYGIARLREAIAQARENERALRLWHPFRSQQIPVSAVVVLWGRGLSKWSSEDQVRVINDVHVVAGPALRRWLERVDGEVLTSAQIETAWAAMDTQVSRRDPIDAELHPIPTSLADWVLRSVAGVSAAFLAVVAFGRLLEVTSHWSVTTLATLLLVLPAIFVCKATSWRPMIWSAWAWGCTLVLLAGALTFAAAATNL